jgi:hypothetical protein
MWKHNIIMVTNQLHKYNQQVTNQLQMLVTNIIQQTEIFFAYIFTLYSLYSKDRKFNLKNLNCKLAYKTYIAH